MTRTPRLRPLLAAAALAAPLLVLTPGTASACPPLQDTCSYDVSRPAWFAGEVVRQFGQLPAPVGTGPTAPSPSRPDTALYLIGNVGATPFAPGGPIPGGLSMPDHDHVWPLFTVTVYDSDGYFVVPGPAATTATVRTRPQPAGSIAGAPLARAVDFGDGWRDLTAVPLIQQGVDRGLLRLVPIGFGGTGWIERR